MFRSKHLTDFKNTNTLSVNGHNVSLIVDRSDSASHEHSLNAFFVRIVLKIFLKFRYDVQTLVCVERVKRRRKKGIKLGDQSHAFNLCKTSP